MTTPHTSQPDSPEETAAALELFERYYALGHQRSLRKLADETSVNLRYLETLSAAHGWQARLLTRQQEEIAAARAAAREEAGRLAKERLNKAQRMQHFGMSILENAHLEMQDELASMKLIREAITLVVEGLKAERVELGESDPLPAPPKPLAEMSDEELAAYQALLETSKR